MRTPGPLRPRQLLAVLMVLGLAAMIVPVALSQAPPRTFRVGGYHFWRIASGQPGCAGAGLATALPTFASDECGWGLFTADPGGAADPATPYQAKAPDPAPAFVVTFHDQTGKTIAQVDATTGNDNTDEYRFNIDPVTWDNPAPGSILFSVAPKAAGDAIAGQTSFRVYYNALGTRLLLDKPLYAAGETLTVKGVTWMRKPTGITDPNPADPVGFNKNVAGTVKVTLTRQDGSKAEKTATAGTDGFFQVQFAPADYGTLTAGPGDGFKRMLMIDAEGTYEDPATGTWKTAAIDEPDRTIAASFRVPTTQAEIEPKFVSETGWVLPGDRYVHQIEYRNLAATPATGVVITDTLPEGAVFESAVPAPSSRAGNALTWNVGTVAPASDFAPSRRILITARAKTTAEDPRVMWKDLSSPVTLTQAGGQSVTSKTHGPKVTTVESARFGDRPFPIVLVDYMDNKHSAASPGWIYDFRVNNPGNDSSLFKLYQEMSYGQLYARGEVASLEVAADKNSYTVPGNTFKWSTPQYASTCGGVTTVMPGTTQTTTYSPTGARVNDGWYQLPGNRQYYGADKNAYIAGAVVGVGVPGGDIDGGCGPAGKLAYDAASAADPDIDYNDFDFDRNGVVDFFETIFQGRGGNGDSQLNGGYDNPWPHSSNLESYYIDGNGERGYVSNDQLRDKLEQPLWWTTKARRDMTTRDMGEDLKAHVRVGPYNINPETGTTSVIAHEYSHSLGTPDLYTASGRTTIGNWDLMSEDNAQFMGVFMRSYLGWMVPKSVPASGLTTTVRDGKVDTHRIDWVDPQGRPYALEGADVHNGDAYKVDLPHRVLIDKVPSGAKAWFSGAGNDFGCLGHTLDIPLYVMTQAKSGDTVKLGFKSWYEIEWDFDYGFVMVSTDGGDSWTALASENGTTTPSQFNPNAVGCQTQYGNGITGTSAQTGFPGNEVDRQVTATYSEPTWIDDSFDLSAYAGQEVLLRFAYATDVGLAKRGWLMDDIKIENTTQKVTYLFDDAEKPPSSYISKGWMRAGSGPAAQDHAYYLELRTRTSFDENGHGENQDRSPTWFIPGVSLWYNDEFNGLGNNGVNDPYGDTVLDPRSEPGQTSPKLDDASFFPLPVLDAFNDTDWTDNYVNPAFEDGNQHLKFGCFNMKVNSIDGLGLTANKGSATANVTMKTNPDKCMKTLAVPQGQVEAKAPARRQLPATGGLPAAAMLGLLLAGAAFGARKFSGAGAARREP